MKDGRSAGLPVSGGGGRALSVVNDSNVVSAIVMSSEMSTEATRGVAGRAICSGGGGIFTSGGNATASISSTTTPRSAASNGRTRTNSPKWSVVATIRPICVQLVLARLNWSFAVSRIPVSSIVSLPVS